ncbi:MAG: hypothetical protein J6L88_06070, partial [Clostridia bacterium]|nr:hypothetical protein [Clostridia bacterium]
QADKTNHDGETEVRGAKPATENESGYTGDTYCLGCEEMIKKGELIPALHDHDYGEDWETDEQSHWHECTCGVAADKGDHVGGEANCHERAVCDTCGKAYGRADKTNHDGETEVRGAKPATEYEDGYTGDTYCLGCNEKIAEGEVIPALHQHSFGSTWERDEDSHWHACKCSAQSDFAAHTYVNGICSVCGHIQRGGAADVPKTSDTFRYGLWAVHLLLSLSALACVLCIRKRSKA